MPGLPSDDTILHTVSEQILEIPRNTVFWYSHQGIRLRTANTHDEKKPIQKLFKGIHHQLKNHPERQTLEGMRGGRFYGIGFSTNEDSDAPIDPLCRACCNKVIRGWSIWFTAKSNRDAMLAYLLKVVHVWHSLTCKTNESTFDLVSSCSYISVIKPAKLKHVDPVQRAIETGGR